jgi:hypothetical protein
MRFFVEDGQPAVRAAAVFAIDKSYELVGRKNSYTIVYRIDEGIAVTWGYDSPEERDSSYDSVLGGMRTVKLS